MFGAWGKATLKGGLIQMRTLDFGEGPWANNSLIAIYHPKDGNSFVNLTFNSFVNTITGISSKIGNSEKYNILTKNNKWVFEGQTVVNVIREIVQFAKNKEDAWNIARKTSRTGFDIVGVGDYDSQKFGIMD
jgi:hypothetical protein